MSHVLCFCERVGDTGFSGACARCRGQSAQTESALFFFLQNSRYASMLETSAPSALADWLSGRRGSHSSGDHPLLVREKLEANYFDPCGARSCQQKRHILQRWRYMHDKFYRHQGQNLDVGEYDYGYGSNTMAGAGGYGMAAGNFFGGGRPSRVNFKSDPEILVDFFFAKFADDGSDPDDPNQVRHGQNVHGAINHWCMLGTSCSVGHFTCPYLLAMA